MGGRVVAGRRQHDRVADMDLFGAPCGGGEEHLGGGVVRILFQEMVFVGPDVVVAKPVGDHHLGQRLLDHPVLGFRIPRAWQLQLVDQTEPHGGRLSCASSVLSYRSVANAGWDVQRP